MSSELLFDLSLGLESTHVLLTGSSGAIGTVVSYALLSAGCFVSALDITNPNERCYAHPNFQWINADISSEAEIAAAFERAEAKWGLVQCCIALASIDLSYLDHHESLVDMELEQWRRTMRVNVEGTFLTARQWMKGIKAAAERNRIGEGGGEVEGEDGDDQRNIGLIIVGSEAGTYGVRGNADYSAGKSAVQHGLVQSLKGDVVRICRNARVNAVAPGPVDTPQYRKECQRDPDERWASCEATTAMGVPVSLESVARTIVYLASQRWSGNTSGQVIHVNSGKLGNVQWKKGEI